MEPVVMTGDHIIVNKIAYGLRIPLTHTYVLHFDGPKVGDVVVLDAPDEDKVLLKRVVATPGTTVEVRSGHVILDGAEAPIHTAGGILREHLGSVDHAILLGGGGGPDFGPVTIPDDQYLVLGDNRGDSRDGRYFGFVDGAAILGRAIGVVWRDGPAWKQLGE
jgi:signal peptidase I